MEVRIPEFCLALMMEPTDAGKSRFARKWFSPTEILSSDNCRALVSDDPANRDCSEDAFATLHAILDKRLKRRRLTVVDATNLRSEDRKTLQEIAREHDCQSVIFAIDTPARLCLERNAARDGRKSPERVVQAHCRRMRMSLRETKKERSRVYQLKPAEANDAVIRRVKMRIDLRDQSGPFDIIGDVHGCQEELVQLLDKLGYREDGVERVVFQEKHMGSRGIVIVGRNPGIIREKFGIDSPAGGICCTRTGRPFFPPELEGKFLGRTRGPGSNRAVGGVGNKLAAAGLRDHALEPEGPGVVAAYLRAGGRRRAEHPRSNPEISPTGPSPWHGRGSGPGRERGAAGAVRRYRETYREYCWETGEEDLAGVRASHLWRWLESGASTRGTTSGR